MSLKVGDKVKWTSQSAGSYVEKVGIVKGIVPPHTSPWDRMHDIRSQLGLPYFWKIMFDGWMPRNHESYLVECPGGHTARAIPRLYWPRVSQLEAAHGVEVCRA